MGSQEDYFVLRNWELQGSVDGAKWITLERHEDDPTLAPNFGEGAWSIPNRGRAGQCPEAYPEGRLGCRTVSCSCPIVVLMYSCLVVVLYLSCTCPVGNPVALTPHHTTPTQRVQAFPKLQNKNLTSVFSTSVIFRHKIAQN